MKLRAQKLTAEIEALQQKAATGSAFSALPLVKQAAEKQAELNNLIVIKMWG
jgi:hypothetical protein